MHQHYLGNVLINVHQYSEGCGYLTLLLTNDLQTARAFAVFTCG
jgi:hypothetical protein